VSWFRPMTIRSQLVVLYLAVLAVLLTALGIFQSVTLRDYLRSSTAFTLRQAAHGELSVLGPCYVRSLNTLESNAQTLARLLGGYETGVMIVTPAGQTLASHGIGPPGATKPMRLSASTVRHLIGTSSRQVDTQPDVPVANCPKPVAVTGSRHHTEGGPFPPLTRSLVSGGNVMLVAVPLGPPGDTLGYAILGRSLDNANAIAGRVLLVFGLGAFAALLVAALLALPLINHALRPLRRVADTAEAIAAGDFEQRAKLSQSHDEVGRLGLAFDAMVDRLQGAMAAAVASEDRMRRFLADASHELRTPVTVLRGTSQVLLRQGGGSGPELTEALSDMHEESVRLARLVDDLLTLSRLDEGQPLAPQPVPVRAFLEEFLHRYAGVWPQRTIHLDETGLNGATAQVDPEALRRVLTNLVDNAARYSNTNGSIRITGRPEGHRVSIAVADDGPGLTSSDTEHVFERFYRANKSRSRSSGGTGLGLPIVAGLVEQSGGSITMDTGPDRGTTITFTLPRADGDSRLEPRS
jgi:two-component system, OmpR family, sensor kinase